MALVVTLVQPYVGQKAHFSPVSRVHARRIHVSTKDEKKETCVDDDEVKPPKKENRRRLDKNTVIPRGISPDENGLMGILGISSLSIE